MSERHVPGVDLDFPKLCFVLSPVKSWNLKKKITIVKTVTEKIYCVIA